jgi:hypothetical protein
MTMTMTMRLHRLAAAAALAMAALHAQAVTTYTFDFAGTQVHVVDPQECNAPVCPEVLISPWNGSLTLTTPDGDGTFLFNGDFSDPNMTLALNREQSFFLGGPLGPFSAVIEDGALTSLTGRARIGPPATWTFDGSAVSYFDPQSSRHGSTIGNATLALPALPVSESETWAMLLAGLGLTGVVRRRRSRVVADRKLSHF